MNIKESGSFADIESRLKEIANTRILVGIPQDNKEANSSKYATNAQKLYYNSKGSPAKNIPPRPVLEPAIQDKFNQISAKIREGAIKALEGDMEGFREDYEMAGLMAQTASINWFDNPKNNWAPNAERTIKAKGSDSPLIDTGEMRKAITYAVVKGNKL